MATLICFTMRKGIKATKTLCNKRTIDKVGDGILCYDKIEAKINSKLAARRQAERDLYYTKPLFNIVSETSEKKPEVKAEAIVIKADTKSKNDRVYSKEVLENTVKELEEIKVEDSGKTAIEDRVEIIDGKAYLKESNTMKKSTSIKRRETIQNDAQKQKIDIKLPYQKINFTSFKSKDIKQETPKKPNGLGVIRPNRMSDPMRNTINTVKKEANIAKPVESSNADIPGYVANYAAPMRSISMGRARFNEVKWLQNALNYCNNAGLKVDGKFGPKTDVAVKNFKLKNGLGKNNTVTSEVDRTTRDLIVEKCNKK
jgi:hypothetical protein